MKSKISLFTFLFMLVAFSNSVSAQYTKLMDADSSSTGELPYGSLISDGTFLYGMTYQGGSNGYGTIFKILPDGTGFAKLLDFNGALNGYKPSGSLIYDGTFLYGMTSQGGTNSCDCGTIFKIKTDGTGYIKLLNFDVTNGANPNESLISDGTFLYGMTTGGGNNYNGNIFKIKTNGTGYATLLHFDRMVNGAYPYGSLISDGTFLYGMTNVGGTNDRGIIFKINTDGTDYTTLFNFDFMPNGAFPQGSLTSDGTFLYGMTSAGGATGASGTIFKINTDGTDYAKLLDFYGLTNGSSPNGSLNSDGTFLYGMTYFGGIKNNGTIFKIKPDGTGYAKLFEFDDTSNGRYPKGSLISDGPFLYGMTTYGGAADKGTVFKLSITTTGITELVPNNQFNIYPNPTNGVFTLKLENVQLNSNSGQLSIYNELGENVYSLNIAQLNNRSIDFSTQPSGIYLVKFYDGENTFSKKISIQH